MQKVAESRCIREESMRLEHVHIENFRCFEQFDLAVAGESLAVVAENAGGKSSLLTAIEWGVGGPGRVSPDDLRDPSQQLIVEATVSRIEPQYHGEFANAIRFDGGVGSAKIGVRAIWDEDAEHLDITWGFPEAGWMRAGRKVRDALPMLSLPTERDAARLVSFTGRRSLLTPLVEDVGALTAAAQALTEIEQATATLAESGEMAQLVQGLRDQLAEVIPEVDADAYTVGTAAQTPEDLLRLFELRLAHRGPPTSVPRQSSGLGQLSIMVLAARIIAAGTEPLLLIDEPELSLHPQAQRAVISRFEDLDAQSLIATHSSAVLAERDLRRVARLRSTVDGAEAKWPANISAQDAG